MSDARVLTIPDVISIGAIVGAAQHSYKVARLMDSGDVVEGTARSIGDQNGAFLATGEDVRDGYLRVTTLQGWEAFWPMHALVSEQQEGTFIVRA